jgi:opacity protein-like surface antigen
MRALIPAIGCLLLVATVTQAQAQSTDPPQHSGPAWELGPYFGMARHSPVTHLGTTPDRNHIFLGVHVTGTLFRWRRWSFAYASEVVPLLIVSNDPRYDPETTLPNGQQIQYPHETGRGPVAGFALSPIGFESQLGLTARWRVYGGSALGAVWFTRDVPVPDSRSFNYTYEFSGGVQWEPHSGRFLRVGYKFHHLSNADTGVTNPGLNGNVLMIGMARRFGRRP